MRTLPFVCLGRRFVSRTVRPFSLHGSLSKQIKHAKESGVDNEDQLSGHVSLFMYQQLRREKKVAASEVGKLRAVLRTVNASAASLRKRRYTDAGRTTDADVDVRLKTRHTDGGTYGRLEKRHDFGAILRAEREVADAILRNERQAIDALMSRERQATDAMLLEERRSVKAIVREKNQAAEAASYKSAELRVESYCVPPVTIQKNIDSTVLCNPASESDVDSDMVPVRQQACRFLPSLKLALAPVVQRTLLAFLFRDAAHLLCAGKLETKERGILQSTKTPDCLASLVLPHWDKIADELLPGYGHDFPFEPDRKHFWKNYFSPDTLYGELLRNVRSPEARTIFFSDELQLVHKEFFAAAAQKYDWRIVESSMSTSLTSVERILVPVLQRSLLERFLVDTVPHLRLLLNLQRKKVQRYRMDMTVIAPIVGKHWHEIADQLLPGGDRIGFPLELCTLSITHKSLYYALSREVRSPYFKTIFCSKCDPKLKHFWAAVANKYNWRYEELDSDM